jgi:predicted dehydrogenase
MSSLLRALETGAPPDIPGRDNLHTIDLCEAVLTSASEHRVVALGHVEPHENG